MSKSTIRRILSFAAVALVAALSAVPAMADAVLDFQVGGTGGGSINYVGGAAPLTGTAIPIRLVSSNATPLNDGVSLAITNGALNFTTGNLISYAGGIMTFAGAGSFNITGSIAALGITNQPLVTGSFLGASFFVNTGRTSLFLGTGSDTKHPTLVSYYFPTAPIEWVFSGGIFAGVPTLIANNAFSSPVTPTSVDIVNTAVPEVGSILMLGTALLITAFLVRRRTRFGF